MSFKVQAIVNVQLNLSEKIVHINERKTLFMEIGPKLTPRRST